MIFNKIEWLRLASSEEIDDKKKALDIAKSKALELQDELLYWFACNTSFAERSAIYTLLDESHQQQALDLIDDKGVLTAFDRTQTLALFVQAESLEMQRAIVQLERWFMKPTDIRNALVLEYKNQKGCELEKAKLEVNRLFVEVPGQAEDNDMGGGRAPEDTPL